MKRIGYLYNNICSTSNLILALRRAVRGKREKTSTVRFLANCKQNIRLLQKRLATHSWTPGPYNTFNVFEPKKRMISAAPFEDRIVHHALMNIVEPVFERFLIFDSYACRRNKGLHKAVDRAWKYQQSFGYFLKCDIRKYFDSVDHNILKKLLGRKFKDRELNRLFSVIIDSISEKTGTGLPIGNLTSQHFANFYLGHCDHFIKDELGIKAYVRYMDDFCIWGNDKKYLQQIILTIKVYLMHHLGLEMKEEVTRLGPVNSGLPFLGFRLFPHTIRINRHSLQRFIKKMRRYDYAVCAGIMDTRKAAEAIQSLYSFVQTAHCERFLHNFSTRFVV